MLNRKALGTLTFIVRQGISFSKEQKLGWVTSAVEGNSESRDTEVKGREQERIYTLAQEL